MVSDPLTPGTVGSSSSLIGLSLLDLRHAVRCVSWLYAHRRRAFKDGERNTSGAARRRGGRLGGGGSCQSRRAGLRWQIGEHTSELQSPCNLVCRLLLEK